MPSLPGRRSTDTLGIGGSDVAMASSPRTVRVPEAYMCRNHTPCCAMRSNSGVQSRDEPYSLLNSAPNDSLDTTTTFSLPSPLGLAAKLRSSRPSESRVNSPPSFLR